MLEQRRSKTSHKSSTSLEWMWILLLLRLVAVAPSSVQSSPLSKGVWGPTDPVADRNATVLVPGPEGSQVRITVLTARMIRVERSNSTSFEDRKTVAVINRNLPNVPFHVSRSNNNSILTLQTRCLTLTYHKGEAFSDKSLQIQGKMHCTKEEVLDITDKNSNGQAKTNQSSEWIYKYGDQDPLNLLGTIRTLDLKDAASLNCSLREEDDHCEWGLVSRSGYAINNDTLDYALSSDGRDWWDGQNKDQEDIYILGHGHDYKAALFDYRKIGGYIPLLPRYAIGVWFSQWFDFTTSTAAAMVKEYELRSLPLDVFVYDLNWHKKNDWTGVSWDRRLHPNPEDATAYFKARGVAVTLSLHDANGVNPWEDRYKEMCQKVGCQDGERIPFSMVNESLAYALEDIVLKPLEDENGVDFWWNDWQQGEKGPGGSAGGKQNPTIWTAHIRCTNVYRRKQETTEITQRSMAFARWGGLGGHRYPLHFSGDVKTLSWDDLAYQPYFSMTAINVGAIWTHDIEGPAQDPELFIRWLQWGVVSGVMRSHERGMASGACAATEPFSCGTVIPWDAGPKYVKANNDGLRLRGSLVPYIYTAAHRAYKTGLWFPTPFYYEWPELEGAYETAVYRPDPQAKYDSQYLFGKDIWVAPVVHPSNKTDGLARVKLWIPPGEWVGLQGGHVLHGSKDGSTSVDSIADLNEIPMFVKAGSIIPSIPVRPGATVGMAMKPYEELIWTIYLAKDAPPSGSGIIYEDDGDGTGYYYKNEYAFTKAHYRLSKKKAFGGDSTRVDEATVRKERGLDLTEDADSSTWTTKMAFTVSTKGYFQKLPSTRATTIRIVNAFPPSLVLFNNTDKIPFSRFGGENTWHFESKDSAVVIELPRSDVMKGVRVATESTGALSDGIGYQLRRATAAKATLDEVRMSPGSQTGQDKSPGYLLKASSSQSTLDYLAGHPSLSGFMDLIRAYETILDGALEEVRQLSNVSSTKGMQPDNADENIQGEKGHVMKLLAVNHVARAITLLESARQKQDNAIL